MEGERFDHCCPCPAGLPKFQLFQMVRWRPFGRPGAGSQGVEGQHGFKGYVGLAEVQRSRLEARKPKACLFRYNRPVGCSLWKWHALLGDSSYCGLFWHRYTEHTSTIAYSPPVRMAAAGLHMLGRPPSNRLHTYTLPPSFRVCFLTASKDPHRANPGPAELTTVQPCKQATSDTQRPISTTYLALVAPYHHLSTQRDTISHLAAPPGAGSSSHSNTSLFHLLAGWCEI